jgi:hypothetical protein
MTVFEHPSPAKDPDAIKSYVGAIQALVAVVAERDAALAQVARVRAAVAYLERLRIKSAEDEDAGYRGSNIYADAYRYAVVTLRTALEDPS